MKNRWLNETEPDGCELDEGEQKLLIKLAGSCSPDFLTSKGFSTDEINTIRKWYYAFES